MPAPITIDFDTRDFQRQVDAAYKTLGTIATKHVPRAAAAALNRTSDRTATRVRRDVARAKSLPQKLLRKKIDRFHASPRRLVARVWIGLKRSIKVGDLPGAQYQFRGVLRAGRVRVSGVFPATMPSGKRGLFVRRLPSMRASRDRSPSAPNLPIEEPQIRLQPEAESILRTVARREVRDYLPREFTRLINLTLQTLRAARGK
jgi:hypothetical protein